MEQGVGGYEEKVADGIWHVPIFAMTADVIQATPDECKRCGMDGYVSKPFEEEQLYRVVAKCLELQSSINGGGQVIMTWNQWQNAKTNHSH